MKKKLLVTIGAMSCAVMLGGCGGRQLIDTTYSFDRAIIQLPDGEIIEGKVSSWLDFEDSDQIQVKINGKTYLVHSENCVLIKD